MKLNQLRYYMAVCKHLNFSKAAEELFVAQPTISTAVKELEEEFGITLVHRLSYGVSLTAEGRQFAQMAKELLDQVQNVEENMAELGNNRNLVRVGLPPVNAGLWFPEIYSGFKSLYPDVSIEMVEQNSQELIKKLADEYLDVIIIPVTFEVSDDFSVIPVHQVETSFCVSPDHPLAGRTSVSITELKDEPLVKYAHQSDFIWKLFLKHGIKPNIILYSGQYHTIYRYIYQGIASSFMTKDSAALFPGIIPISLDTPVMTDISIVTKKSRNLFKAPRNFINFVQKFPFNEYPQKRSSRTYF